MLEPDGRMVLLDQLRPPPGYRLVSAVTTTFTLQLTAALVAPLAFASHEMRTRPDPIAALEAVRSCADRVDIFCQAGQIIVPSKASDLMAFLEPMVHPVRQPRPGFLFHPKIWFLRYAPTREDAAPTDDDAGQPDAYRLLCSSRNLVDSHAWDTMVTLDGVLGEDIDPANTPLAALLRHLPEWAVDPIPDDRRSRINNLADRAARMRWTPPDEINTIAFHAFGVPGVTADPDFRGKRHLVVSPFINDAGLTRVTGGREADVSVVSRAEELDVLEPSRLQRLHRPEDEDAVFVLDPLAGLGPREDDAEPEQPGAGGDRLAAVDPRQESGPVDADGGALTPMRPAHLDVRSQESELSGLHAKITVVERNYGEAHVFLGSANATSAAYGGNIEFVLELVGRAARIGVNTLLARGDGAHPGFRDLLQPYRPGDAVEPPDDDALKDLEALLRKAAAVPFRLRIEPDATSYTLRLSTPDGLGIPDDHRVSLGLLTLPGVSREAPASQPCDLAFTGVALADISPFVVVRITDPDGLSVSTVVHAALVNDPPDRLDAVLARQVDTREKFLRFLALLLGLSDVDPGLLDPTGPDGATAGFGAGHGSAGVFELLIGALAERPQALADLDRLVSRLRATESGRDILPTGFEDLWTAVLAARARAGGRPMNERRAFSATPVLDGLTGFQRNTVEHVIDRFYGPDPHDRFLVADETGLGKTMVARGVIARTIEELQHHDHVDRINVVYVCSNQDLAQQNLSKLNVTGSDQLGIASRLTLLAKHLHAMGSSDGLRKPVNLVSFTPGTSFTKGSHTGKAEERAMLYLLLRDRLHLRGVRRGTRARRVLRGTLESPDGIADRVRRLEAALPNGLNPQIQEAFLDAADQAGLLDQFEDAMAQVMRLKDPRPLVTPLVSELRNVLARASVATLTPDLVILDEFQRFRELTDPTTEAGELAHHLFRYRDEASDHRAKVLLLSATPLKPFTYAEEADLGDDHHRDFLSLVEFLANGDARITDGVRQALHDYRSAVVTGRAAEGLTATVRDRLLQVMSRTERPRAVLHDQTTEIVTDLGTPPADDLLGFVALKDLARTVEAPFSIEYWKSAPYFVNFMDGYKLADRVRAGLGDPLRADAVRERLSRTQRIDFAAVDQNAPIPLSNPRLRALAEDTIGAGWWKLLWVPPSLPYLTPDGPYAEPWATAMTKLLVFSSWTATPTAVASLLSYEADRMTAGDALGATPDERRRERDSRRTRLNYRIDRDDDRDRPSSMSTLALFWPAPGLAALADPRAAHRHNRTPASPLSAADLVADVAAALASETADDPDDSGEGPIASAWFEILRRTDSFPPGLSREQVRAAWDGADAAAEVASAVDDPESAAADADERATDSRGRHVDLAFDVRGRTQDRRVTDDTRATVAELAAHGPGTIAYRALGRVAGDHPGVTDAGLWRAAVRVASALRTLFSRPETTLLLDHLIPGSPPEVPYWRKILTYCAWGNLQAALDEHVHHLHVSQGAPALDDDSLQEFAALVAEPLVLRASRYEVFDPDRPDERPRFPVRFALRYGGKNEGQENERQPVLRRAFNSPFWPFVLATTSVGQEGVDFHWWSHALLHWNTPANPVDFEQREGRVDRYDGHAVRKNLAARHRGAILGSEQPDPWRAAYELAREDTGDLGEFAPHWVFPGEATIQRHVAPYLLSVDETRLADIKRDVALYRMTFGQPRQEDLLEMLRRRLSEASSDALAALHLDLSAPAAPPRAPDPEPSPVGDPYEDEADPESQQSEAEPATGPVGDWYVAFGADDQGRQWEDGRRYGFVSAGGGQWYSRTLRHVPAGARVWVYVPGRGYVAAGTTLGAAVRFDQLRVDINGELVRVAEQPLVGRYMHGAGPQTDDLAEWAIPVRWHVTVSVTDAFRESGLFANQNSACPLRDTPTLERLRDRFGDPSSD